MTPSIRLYNLQLFCKIGIEFSNLGCVGNEVFICRLHVFALHLERLFPRLGAHKLLCSRRMVLERSLAIIREPNGNCLETFRYGTKGLHRSVHVFPSAAIAGRMPARTMIVPAIVGRL